MLIAAFPAGPWATNCYVVAPAAGQECVVIDPGHDALSGVADVVRDNRLRPVAVLVTHGHLDHTWCVAPVSESYGAVAYIHADDRALLANPMAGLSADMVQMLVGLDLRFAEPDDVREVSDGRPLEIAGLTFAVDHAPGHTPGSVTFRTEHPEPEVSEVMFAGDLLFAGSIGRTDLPGGDHQTMLRSLATKVLPLDDRVVVLPGHGEQTTIGRERRSNPYLAALPVLKAGQP